MWHAVPFACQRRPTIGVSRMCWLLPGSFDCFCCPHTSVHRPSIACLAVFLCGPGALFLHALSGLSTICPFPPHSWSAPDGLLLLLRKQPIWAAGDTPHLMPVEQGLPWHPVTTGLAGQAIPFIVAASHAHAPPFAPFWFPVPAVLVASPALLCPSSLSAVPALVPLGVAPAFCVSVLLLPLSGGAAGCPCRAPPPVPPACPPVRGFHISSGGGGTTNRQWKNKSRTSSRPSPDLAQIHPKIPPDPPPNITPRAVPLCSAPLRGRNPHCCSPCGFGGLDGFWAFGGLSPTSMRTGMHQPPLSVSRWYVSLGLSGAPPPVFPNRRRAQP